MIDIELKNICVNPNSSMKEVLNKIQKNGKNGVFVINKNFLLKGIITDADIRKKILEDKFNNINFAKDIMQKKISSIQHKNISKCDHILINSTKILMPILKNRKLVDYCHIDDLKCLVKKKEKKKILIIGGLGYIGSILVKNLISKGYYVNILDKNLYGNPFNKSKIKNLNIIIGDCFSKKKLSLALAGCTSVVHLGEIVGDPAVALNMKNSIKNNFEATDFVLNECLKNKVERFIFTSSCSVYGYSNKVCTEKSKLNPVSLYAKCKIACEEQILSHSSKKITSTIIRLATVHGDSLRKRFDLVVNKFFIFGLLKKKITLFGEKNWRPLVSVDDVVKSIIIILNSPKTKISRQILNVGFSQENFTIGDIAKKIKKIINFDFKIVPQLEDTRSYKVSFKKIEKYFKFKPTLTLNQSLKKMKDVYYNKKINLNNINFYNEKKIKFLLNKKN
tara:strand:- start:886 stop:2232 length:1347 start_codon:yes stop_codon:yes gene_type:complete